MNKLSKIIVHLLHNTRIKKSDIFVDEFSESFNVNFENPTLDEKIHSITYLQENGYIQIDDDGYLGLTEKGGQFWESEFLIDWRLYFEYSSQFIDDKEYIFLYAVDKQTIQLAIDKSNGLLNDCEIKIAQNWQAIYWQAPFDGYYIKKAINSDFLPYFDEILPNYCKHIF